MRVSPQALAPRQPDLSRSLTAGRFGFAQAGIVVEFSSSSSFTLKQGGGSYRFKKAVL